MLFRPAILCGLLSVLLFGMTGCFSSFTSSSSLSDGELQAKLIVGKTTQSEVQQLYGQPTTVKNAKSGAIWTYVFNPSAMSSSASTVGSSVANAAMAHGIAHATLAGTKAGGIVGGVAASSAGMEAVGMASSAMRTDTKSKILTINFDKAGIVKSYSMN